MAVSLVPDASIRSPRAVMSDSMNWGVDQNRLRLTDEQGRGRGREGARYGNQLVSRAGEDDSPEHRTNVPALVASCNCHPVRSSHAAVERVLPRRDLCIRSGESHGSTSRGLRSEIHIATTPREL